MSFFNTNISEKPLTYHNPARLLADERGKTAAKRLGLLPDDQTRSQGFKGSHLRGEPVGLAWPLPALREVEIQGPD